MRISTSAQTAIHDGGGAEEEDKPLFEFAGQRQFILLALAALLIASMFHWNAMVRAEGPFIADSVEYLTMARYVSHGLELTVNPVRSGVFPIMLAVPLWLERAWHGGGSPISGGGSKDPSIGLWLLFLFNTLAILGTYRLGRLLRGPWTGLLAAYFTALLPEFTRWSFDFLTDVPAATFGMWAIVYWVERKPFRVGLMLGMAVTMRYQCLIPLGAFFVVPVLLRRWRDLWMMFLGLVPAAALLGAADAYFWNTPFHSLMLFVPRQLTTFLPADVVAKFMSLDTPVHAPSPATNQTLENYAASSKLWYIEQSKWIFTKPLLYAFIVYPFARRSMRSRSGADMTLWVTAATLLVLSAQRYKESRYLVAIVPMISVLGASGAMWVITGVVRMLGRTGFVAVGTGCVLLVALGFSFNRGCRVLQRRIWLSPFGSYLEAVEAIPESVRPCTIGIERLWMLSLKHPVHATGKWAWFSEDFASYDLAKAVGFFQTSPEKWGTHPGRHVLEQLDYVMIPPPFTPTEMARTRWLNEHTLFEGYFYSRRENETACLLLKRAADPGDARPFWNLNDPRAREEPVIAGFAGGVELIAVDAQRLDTAWNGVKIETRWRLPETENLRFILGVKVMNEQLQMLARYQTWIVPGDPVGRAERQGVALRDTRYLSLLESPGDKTLRIELRIVAYPRKGEPPIAQQLILPGSGETPDPRAGFLLDVPLLDAVPDELSGEAPQGSSELNLVPSG